MRMKPRPGKELKQLAAVNAKCGPSVGNGNRFPNLKFALSIDRRQPSISDKLGLNAKFRVGD